MAPKISVPADFGRHHLGSPSHGNLAFNMKKGDPIKANSIILSLNSPVIDDLTTNLHLTSLDMEDFSREAVDCFIEASYTGEIEAVTLKNFRDVCKMSYVFNVSWLSDRCTGYFDDYLRKLDTESSYNDLAFAVDEAVYQLSTIKKKIILDLVVQKFIQLSTGKLESFFKEYLSDFGASTTSVKLDCCIAIAQSNIHIIIEIFLDHLENKELKVLDASSRALLKKADLDLCFQMKSEVHKRFFTVLDQITASDHDDFKLILSLLQQFSNPTKEIVSGSVPACSMSLKPYLNSDSRETVESILNNRCITNLYLLFDAVWTWHYQKNDDYADHVLLKMIIEKKLQQKWERMSAEYVKAFRSESWADKMKNLVLNCEELMSNDDNTSKMTVICEFPRDQFVKEIFSKSNIFRFILPNNSTAAGQVFELNLSASGDGNPDLFSIQWRRLFDKPTGIDATHLPTLHFALRIFENKEWWVLPISFCGKPTCDKTMKYWNWGYIEFHDEDAITEDNMVLGSDGYVNWERTYYVLDDSRVQLVCFQVD